MSFAKPKCIFVNQSQKQREKPKIIGLALTNPNRTWMIKVGGLINIVKRLLTRLRDVVRRREELSRFQNHFDDMFVGVVAGGDDRIRVEIKDVHNRILYSFIGFFAKSHAYNLLWQINEKYGQLKDRGKNDD